MPGPIGDPAGSPLADGDNTWTSEDAVFAPPPADAKSAWTSDEAVLTPPPVDGDTGAPLPLLWPDGEAVAPLDAREAEG